jgi:hypothetical protein
MKARDALQQRNKGSIVRKSSSANPNSQPQYGFQQGQELGTHFENANLFYRQLNNRLDNS